MHRRDGPVECGRGVLGMMRLVGRGGPKMGGWGRTGGRSGGRRCMSWLSERTLKPRKRCVERKYNVTRLGDDEVVLIRVGGVRQEKAVLLQALAGRPDSTPEAQATSIR
jgi:hypothetical protein